ncbi:hypothetical protein [Faecalicatena contorta]
MKQIHTRKAGAPAVNAAGLPGGLFYDVLVTVQAGLSYCEFYDWRRICAG